MEKRPGDPIRYQIRFRDQNTGSLVDPDALLVGTIVRNGVDDTAATSAFPMTITRQAAGQFGVTATAPINYVNTDDLQIRIEGAVNGTPFSNYSRYTVVSKLNSDLPTAAAIATAVWTDTSSGDFAVTSSPGKILAAQLGGAFTSTSSSVFSISALTNAPSGSGGSGASAAAIAAAVWDEPKLAHSTAGTFGMLLDAAVSTRSTYAGGAVAAVAAPVTVGTNNDKSGYSLSPAGLDPVQVEAGVNFRQAMSPILAASAGVLLGAGTGSIVIKGGNVAVTRITATTDNAGNRTAVTLLLPA